MLSSTATLLLGESLVSIDILRKLLSTTSKFSHGLVLSDLNPKDHQNFSSCQKICRDEILELLKHIERADSTRIYFSILRSVIHAYHEKSTSYLKRIYLAWYALFIVRIWLTWIENTRKEELDGTLNILTEDWDVPCPLSKTSKRQFFLTWPTIYSIELNAHTLVYLALLVIQGDLPKEALSIDRFNSQSCESTFRMARSMSGPFSNIVNFTVSQFFDRAEKISVLNSIKSENTQDTPTIRFPRHHKHARSSNAQATTEASSLTILQIEITVRKAFNDASALLETVGIMNFLRKRHLSSLAAVNSFVRTHFDNNSMEDLLSQPSEKDLEDNFAFRELIGDDESDAYDQLVEEDNQNDDDNEEHAVHNEPDLDEEIEDFNTDDFIAIQPTFKGMRVHDQIRPHLVNSYFKIRINGVRKYVHKQTACYILSEQKQTLSSDRTKRVTQTK